jgi:sialate O-acetylesterase
MKNISKIALTLTGLMFGGFIQAQVRLPKLISDGMILQRDHTVKLWGWATQNEKVTLEFKGKIYQSVADVAGRWQIQLPSQAAGGPYKMTFKAGNTIELNNILFGDVWVAAGQSNMELPMERVQDKYPAIIANANYNQIRQFEVPDKYDFNRLDTDLNEGSWIVADKDHIRRFSAVGFFFANELFEKYHVPIGLINTALGGSPAQAWLSEDALKQFPDYYNEAQKFRDKNLIKEIDDADTKRSKDWYSKLNELDEGSKNHWSNAAVNDSDWSTMNIPGYWADGALGSINGSIWFRKSFNLPESFLNKPSKLLLGRIVDADSVFVNGTYVGNTTYLYPPRRYLLPTDLLKKGTNEIAIRVINNSGKGGFVYDKTYAIVEGDDSFDLKGSWKYKLGTTMEPLPGQTFIRWKPMGLYNGMIAPIVNYNIKGVIWYQGEANVSKPTEYVSLMTALIGDWRHQWNQGDFPFITVQLANFQEAQYQPSESNWAALRQAQLNTLSVANTGMAVAIDVGEWNDIHPVNKKEVGDRLAIQAMKLAYKDKTIIASGPLPDKVSLVGKSIEITFINVGKGLVTKNHQPLKYFAIAGSDGKFIWATAEIKGDKVIVHNDDIPHPAKVRYAWADNPDGANLYNAEGLPASPFEVNVK